MMKILFVDKTSAFHDYRSNFELSTFITLLLLLLCGTRLPTQADVYWQHAIIAPISMTVTMVMQKSWNLIGAGLYEPLVQLYV